LVVYANKGATQDVVGATTGTDAKGRFSFREVPTGQITLRVDGTDQTGQEVVATRVTVPADDRLEPMVIEAARLRSFRLIGGLAPSIAAIAAVGKNGGRLKLFHREFGQSSGSIEWALDRGRSGVVWVSETATELLLLDGRGETVRRVGLRLIPGKTLEVNGS
jgi:hypothetical protein